MRIRGDFGVAGAFLVASACSSRTSGALSSGDRITSSNKSAREGDASVMDASVSEAGAMATHAAAITETTERAPTADGGASAPAIRDGGTTSQSVADAFVPFSEAGADEMFQVNAHLAYEQDPDAPPTVVIVTWSTTVGTPDSATVEFGISTEYGESAPVDLTASTPRAVLVGLKPARASHFRIKANVGGRQVVSGDYSITTGLPPADEVVSIDDYAVLSAERHERGYLLGSYWNGRYEGMVFILDQDGDLVWWYRSGLNAGVAKAAISADGRDLWMVSAGNIGGEDLVRVGLDGLRRRSYANTGGSHDVVAIERDVMAFIAYDGPGTVSEIDRAGERRALFDANDFPVSGTSPHHLNALAFDRRSKTYALSSLDADVYLFPSAGATPTNTARLTAIAGANTGWGGKQHGVQLLADDHLLMFANMEGGASGPSTVIEYDLDDGSEVWRYEADLATANFGGVQRLPGGNTLVTYSNAGVIREVTPEREVVLDVTTTRYLGYVTWLPSLYGSSGSPGSADDAP